MKKTLLVIIIAWFSLAMPVKAQTVEDVLDDYGIENAEQLDEILSEYYVERYDYELDHSDIEDLACVLSSAKEYSIVTDSIFKIIDIFELLYKYDAITIEDLEDALYAYECISTIDIYDEEGEYIDIDRPRNNDDKEKGESFSNVKDEINPSREEKSVTFVSEKDDIGVIKEVVANEDSNSSRTKKDTKFMENLGGKTRTIIGAVVAGGIAFLLMGGPSWFKKK